MFADAALGGTQGEQLASVVPVVERLVDIDPLVALKPHKPGVGESIVWARALEALGSEARDGPLDATLGVALKVREDIERIRIEGVLTNA